MHTRKPLLVSELQVLRQQLFQRLLPLRWFSPSELARPQAQVLELPLILAASALALPPFHLPRCLLSPPLLVELDFQMEI